MAIQLYSKLRLPIPMSSVVPSRLKPYAIDGAEKWVAEDGDNDFFIQEFHFPRYTVRIRSLFLRRPDTYFIQADGTIYFQTSLHGTLDYQLAGFERRIMVYHRQYNVIYSPAMYFTIQAQKFGRPLHSLELWFKEDYLSTIPNAMSFLKRVRDGRPAKLFEQSQYTCIEMMSFIELVLSGASSPGDFDRMNAYVSCILESALAARKPAKTVILKPAVVERIYQVVDLLDNLESKADQINLAAGAMQISPHDLSAEVARHQTKMHYDSWTDHDLVEFAGMSYYKFQMSFKKLYGRTVRKFRKDLVWQSAVMMLISGSANLKRISAWCGHTQGNFSRGFKQRLGCTPLKFVQEFEKKFENTKNSDKRITGDNLEEDI